MVKEVFLELYNKQKEDNNFLSEKEVLNLTTSFLNGTLGKWGNRKMKSNNSQKNIIFGLKSGVVFYEREVLFIINKGKIQDQNYNSKTYPFTEYIKMDGRNLKIQYGYQWYSLNLSTFDTKFFKSFFKLYDKKLYEKHNRKIVRTKKIKENKKIKVNKEILYVVDKFDKDKDGIIDLIQVKDEFNQLLKKHQKVVIEKEKEFNKNYIQQFIKVGNYLKDKRSNLQLIFDCIKNVQNQNELNEYVDILENEIYSYNLLLLNSLNLLVTLIEDDRITFYAIYEKFDKLNIYNSNWENEMSQKLTTLNSNIKGLMYEIRDMGNKISNSIQELSYITEESNRQLTEQLSEIDSTMKVGNLINTINTYQNYKINKNTKSLRA